MEDPRDSLNFEIGWFKASAIGRFTIVAVLIFLLALAVSVLALGPAKFANAWYPEVIAEK